MTEIVERPGEMTDEDLFEVVGQTFELYCGLSYHPAHERCGERASHMLVFYDAVCDRWMRDPVCPDHGADGLRAAMSGSWCVCCEHRGHKSYDVRLVHV